MRYNNNNKKAIKLQIKIAILVTSKVTRIKIIIIKNSRIVHLDKTSLSSHF